MLGIFISRIIDHVSWIYCKHKQTDKKQMHPIILPPDEGKNAHPFLSVIPL